MATLDWDGLVFYDQQIKKHIENKLVNEAISKDELDKILDKYASKTYVADEIAKATTGIDLTIYAKTSDVDAKLANYVKKIDAFNGDYNNLTNKPTIPDISNLATKVELTNYVKKTDAFSGNYNDLTNKPNIPDISNLATKVELKNHTDNTAIHVTSAEKNTWNSKLDNSDLTNYATKTYVADEIAKVSTSGTVDLSGYAKTSDVDTKLTNYVKKADAFSGNYNDLTDKPTIPDTSNLATKTELNNHGGSTKHITDDERTKWNGYNYTINTMKTNFEDGVNTIYNAVVAKGVTPLDKSPSNVAKAIESLEIKEKGQLLLTCKSNSDKLPAPKFNNDNSYNYTCEDIDNSDGTFTRNIYGTKEINQICFYGDENSTGYFKSLEYTTNVKLLTAKNMFYACNYLEYINLNNIDTSKCKSFENMFCNCNYLKSLDVSKFNTLQVTNMSNMFISCKSLTSLDVSNFNTSQVTNMYQMFNSCTSLTSLDVSNFNTSQVTNMSSMFSNCESLTSLDLSNFDTQKVTSMSYMFSGCKSLTSLDLSNFSTENIQYISNMFNGVPSTCTIYVDKTKFTKTETQCGFTGTFTDVSQRG